MSTNPNMETIQTITVSATSAANITFSNIPQTYTDLVLVLSGRTTQPSLADSIYFTFNSSTSNFSSRVIYNDGSSASMFTQARYAGSQPGSTATTSTFSNIEVYIPGYTNNRNKSYLVDSVSENNATTGYIYSAAGLWSDTSAINSIVLTPNAGSFVQHSTATLYGVTAFVGEQGGKATGGTVTSDSNYWYHTFTNSGNFIPSQNITVDYLLVAGGGGSCNIGGGGGAGGLRSTVTATGGGGSLESPISLSNGIKYAVIVGAGGAGVNNTAGFLRGNSGSDSSILGSGLTTITSIGGGGGGSWALSAPNNAGLNGGSGGGGSESSGGGVAGPKGLGTANQGYDGGDGNSGPAPYGGGGGGGAGGAGVGRMTAGTGANGGAALAVAITGSTVYYAGGGGGGWYSGTGNRGLGGGTSTVSQKGGGGDAGPNTGNSNGTSGSANTGGGGGGGHYTAAYPSGLAASGGSGIVIIRYAK